MTRYTEFIGDGDDGLVLYTQRGVVLSSIPSNQPDHPSPHRTTRHRFNNNHHQLIMINIRSPIKKKSTINLVTILIKFMLKRKKEKIDMRWGMIELPNILRRRNVTIINLKFRK